MIKLKVIVPVEEPTDWVSSYVAVEKPDKTLRLCLDPRELNKAIKRPLFELPTTEEILSRISTGKLFTASAAYWQIPVDYESSRLLTFSTPFGRYRYLRMPYGISSASDVCQKYISEVVSDVIGATNSQDDIIIWADNEDELRQRTIKVFKAIRRSGLKLNRKKCFFNLTELVFLGHKITADGICPDETKIEAIVHMKYPTNVKGLQRFLGSINYLGKFIPNLSDKTVSLRKLLQKEVKWVFEENHKKEIDVLKTMITETPILQKFNEKLPTRVSCDASSTGLGAILEQKKGDQWYPIAYASRSLTSAERNYCQLERETLSILFACNKFHQYVYGRKFYVYNDHKPLKSIFNKPLSKAPARIQRFLLRLQQYDLDLHYIKGSLLYIPDTLSRCSLDDDTPELTDDEIQYYVHSIISKELISNSMMKQLVVETEKDETLKVLRDTIMTGWPENKKGVPDIIAPYYKHRDELTIFEDIILRNNTIIVPSLLRKTYMKLIHTGHIGIEKTKLLARNTMYWPGISKQIDELIQSCESCQLYRNQQKKESELKHEIPERPWTKVGIDLFTLNSNDFVIVVDYTTNYFDLSLIPNKKSSTVATHTKRIFSRYGIPKTVISDNGPEFIGKSYKEFSTLWDFEHIHSSPNYPESNGQIERTIQYVKKTIKKALSNDQDPYLAVLSIKATPGPYNNAPPATAMFQRPLRTLVPSVNNSFNTINKKINNKGRDRKGVDLKTLEVNDEVRLYNGKSWSIKGTIVEVLKYPRSYMVLTTKGRKLRRNRRQILLTKKAHDTNNIVYQDDDCLSIISYPILDEAVPNDQINQPLIPNGGNNLLVHQQLHDGVNDYEVEDVAEEDLLLNPEFNESNNDEPLMTTRSGRTIKPPSYLSNFDLT